jgi:DNA-directed RNA polymerase subunit RPC12/RpoP
MKLAGVCPACESHVEFVTVPSGGGRVYKCSNCWHYLDDAELKRAQIIADALWELELQRTKILEGK